MKLAEAAAQLRLSPQLVRLWIQNGTCPFGMIIRDGERRTYLINEAALKKFIEGDMGGVK